MTITLILSTHLPMIRKYLEGIALQSKLDELTRVIDTYELEITRLNEVLPEQTRAIEGFDKPRELARLAWRKKRDRAWDSLETCKLFGCGAREHPTGEG
jgi:hypothetical protein